MASEARIDSRMAEFSRRRSRFETTVTFFRRYPVFPVFIILVLAVAAIFAPLLSSHDPERAENYDDNEVAPFWYCRWKHQVHPGNGLPWSGRPDPHDPRRPHFPPCGVCCAWDQRHHRNGRRSNLRLLRRDHRRDNHAVRGPDSSRAVYSRGPGCWHRFGSFPHDRRDSARDVSSGTGLRGRSGQRLSS